jgi:2-succinyl-5-enolpyruvyl-6-hydroxy-3-cyclohexene-1-carboxylate synthase
LPGEHAVISPGSRNAPLIYALKNSTKTCHSVIDERSAAFVALGIAKHSRQPVILCCTSGTAAINFYPAIAEAYYARVPLIVLTADRPAEQIDAWDGQAIRQKGLYKNHVRAEFQTADQYEDETSFKDIALRVLKVLDTEIAGPIHVNVPIREPFYHFTLEGLSTSNLAAYNPPVSVKINMETLAQHFNWDLQFKKVLVFNGMQDGEQIEVENEENTVILSDITSNRISKIGYWDSMLFSGICKENGLDFLAVLRPDILITTGTTTVSKGLKKFLQHYKPPVHIHLSEYDEVGDMFGTSPVIVNPKIILKLNSANHDSSKLQGSAYLHAWINLSKEFQSRFAQLDWSRFNDFCSVNYILSKLPNDAVLHVSNSMPVRYVSYLLNNELTKTTLYANRGTSGIDGSTSTAVGHALTVSEDVYLITGDIAFFYDINGLFNAALPANLKIIILNNSSGGIFEMIEGPDQLGDALRYQTTPHSYTAENIAEHFKLAYFKGDTLGSFALGMDNLLERKTASILEIFTSHESNIEFYNSFKKL